MHRVLADDPGPNELRKIIWACGSPKIKLLWEIFCETGLEDVALLEERVYQYGGMIKEQDYLAREIFLGMIFLLEEMKKHQR